MAGRVSEEALQIEMVYNQEWKKTSPQKKSKDGQQKKARLYVADVRDSPKPNPWPQRPQTVRGQAAGG